MASRPITDKGDLVTRIFVDMDLAVGKDIQLPETAARHLVQVLRLRDGAAVTLFNGRGGEYGGVLKTQRRHESNVAIEDFAAIERESDLAITLVQAVSRGERMDYAIQKAVELGVHRIVPLQTRRTTVHLVPARAERRMQHWLGIIRHACEQCGRNRIPILAPIHGFEEILKDRDCEARVMMNPRATDEGSRLASDTTSIELVVGPEGGLDDDEIGRLRDAGFLNLRLGPRILRTETAAVAGLTMLQARFGDLNPAS